MTHLEAITTIENALTNLKLKWPSGEPKIGLEAIGAIHNFDPFELSILEDKMYSGSITPLEYMSGMLILINRFKQEKYR